MEYTKKKYLCLVKQVLFMQMFLIDYRRPLQYSDKGKVWFTDLEMAKKHLRETTGKKRIHEIEEGYWE